MASDTRRGVFEFPAFRSAAMPMSTEPGQTAEQSEGDQHQTRWLGDGPERFGIEEIVHHDEVANRAADNAVGHDRIEARGESNPADSLAAIGNSTQEAQPLVARDQSVSRENQRIALVEELDLGQGGDVDVDEDRAEGAGGGAIEVPGTKKRTSVMLLPTAVNSFCALKV